MHNNISLKFYWPSKAWSKEIIVIYGIKWNIVHDDLFLNPVRSHYTTNIQSFFPWIAEGNEKASEREIACAIQQRFPIFLPCLCVSPSLAHHALSRAHISCDCYVAQAITLPSGFIAVRIIFALLPLVEVDHATLFSGWRFLWIYELAKA